MKRYTFPLIFLSSFFFQNSFAQQGIHGPKVIGAGTTIVNEYTAITALASTGSTSITVAASTLNANGRFSGPLVPGDLVMIYQVEGTIINGPVAIAADTTWGRIAPGDLWSTGYYELHQVVSVPNGTTINIDCGLSHDYFPNAGTARKPMVVRVPRYTTLTINSGGILSCDDWNGTIGGVLAVEVQGNTVINGGGFIDVSGKGFRGGALSLSTQYGTNTTASTNVIYGAEKGEGVAGFQAEYDVFGGRYCRGAAANAGGGGDGHNGGGGGGANAPNSTSALAFWSGNGIPDQSGGGWTTAWNIEPPINTMSLRTAVNSAGGGRGGYSFSNFDANALTVPPGNVTWTGDNRNHQATGLGGRILDYSGGRLFFGGGGGAGDQNDGGGGAGGDGGGLVFLMVFGNISGSGTVNANGLNGGNGTGGVGLITGIDGAGGGGGGGAVVLNAVGGVANTIAINATGGNGGNQVINLPFSTPQAEGPGGGGGGGYITVSSGAPTRVSNGGNNGTTNSASLTEFTPNGATKGCPGTNNATITNFTINVTNITICTGNSVTLTATLGGTPPGGVLIEWYSASVGGAPISTGPSYTTPGLAITTTYWVGTCPGWWRVPVTVTVAAAPVVTASASSLTICSGSSTTLTGGGAVTYVWNPGNVSGSPIVVSPAVTTTYTVTGTIVVGCSSTASVTVTVNPTPTVTATASSPTICAGSSTTLTGGGAASYVWNPGNISGSPIVVSPASTTTYTVTGTSLGCTSTQQVTVTVNPSPTVTATATSTTICSGNSTTLSAAGASTYNWMPGNHNGSPWTVTPAATTTYTVTGTAVNGCTSTQQVTITVNPTPTVTATASSATICLGGSSTLTGGGATTYNWNPGNINGSPIIVSPIATTTYTVTGTSGTCTSTAQVIVTVNPTPTVTATASSPTICSGNPTTLTGGGAVTYNWNPGNISGSPIVVTPASTTTYTVTGTAANGCTSTQQVIVTVNASPTVTATAGTPTICNSGSSTLTGGGALTYNWNPGNINGSPIVVSPVTTTTYTVTGTAANGCTATQQVTITVVPTPTVTASALPTSICVGSSTSLTAVGATTYNWMPGNINGSPIVVSPVATTTYTVTGTSGSCTSTASVTVTVIPTPTVTATASSPTICAGSATTLTGGGAVSYNWNPGNINGSPIVVTPASTTTYTVTGTGANGCTSIQQVTVTVNPLPVVTASSGSPAICLGNSTTLTGGGASTYNWNPGNINGSPITISPIVTTTYTVTGTGASGCTNTANVTVTVNPTPTVTATTSTPSICVGASATLTGGGALTYNWNPGNITGSPISVSPVTTTTYTVTGTSALGCTSTAQVIVTVNPLPTPTATSAPAAICLGQSASLTASGGTSYVWNGGALVNANGIPQNVSPVSTTTYTVSATDVNGCSANAQVTLTVNPLPTPNAGINQTICAGNPASLLATGGGTYSWNGGTLVNASGAAQSVSPIITTDYIVTVTNGFGCTKNDTVNIAVNPLPTTNAGPNVSICPSSSIQLNASGATTYLWSPSTGLNFNNISNPMASPIVTTTYVVTGTSAAGCVLNDTIVVTISNILSVFAGPDVTICSGDTILLSTAGGVVYNWTPSATLQTPTLATTNAFPTSTTTYTVNVTDANSCSGSDSITVFVNPSMGITTSGTTPICDGQSATLNATPIGGTGPFTYNWSNSLSGPGPQTVSPNTTITYTVSITDSNGCSSPVQNILVTVNPTPSATLQSSSNVSCFGGSNGTATVNASGGTPGYSYSWLPNGGTAVTGTSLSNGIYTCTITDAAGCTTTQSVTMTQPTAIQLANASSPEHCTSADGSASVSASGGTPGFTFTWSNSSTNDTISNLTSGSYTVVATDANGCIDSTTVVVGNTSGANANAGTAVTITAGQSTVLNGSGGVSYTWSPPAGLSCTNCQFPVATPSVTTVYTLTVTDANGCTDSDTVTVFVDIACGEIFVPNAFSPNGDNANDTFYVRGNCIKFMQFEIYNRWGEKVFSSTDPAKGWDGTWRGEKCEAATFTYFLRATLIDDTQINKQGTISLVK